MIFSISGQTKKKKDLTISFFRRVSSVRFTGQLCGSSGQMAPLHDEPEFRYHI